MKDRAKSLRQLYCEKTGCQPEQFEASVVGACLYSTGLPKLVWAFDRSVFDADLEMVRCLAETSSLAEFRQEMAAFRHANPPTGFLRRRLKARVSTRKLLRFAAGIFPAQAEPPPDKSPN